MRKTIAVFTGEVGGDFQHIIMDVITEKANALGYDVYAFCSHGTYNDDIIYSEGEKSIINIPDMDLFDGIIITEDLFDTPGMEDALYEVVRRDAKCPVVFLRTLREGCYSILLENTLSIESVTRHFTEHHGFTDICYMSGKKGSLDSLERLQGFYNVMQEAGIPITEHMIYHGDFWRNRGKQAVEWFMEGRETYPEAIICANDYMALSVCDELRKRGVRVPEDVCVTGFDFIDEAKNFTPSLTSLEVDFESMSARAVEIIDNVNNGIHEELIQRIPAKLVLNKSCGCGKQYELSDFADVLEENYRKTSSAKDNMLLTMEYQDCVGFDEVFEVADKYRFTIKSHKSYFCFADQEEEGFDDVENASLLTNQVVLSRIFEGDDVTKQCDIKFPKRTILPAEYLKKDEPNNLYIFTIHFKNILFGYMVVEKPVGQWFDVYTQSYLLNLAIAIENSIIQSRLAKLEEIRSLYQMDSLTGLYNRRGIDRFIRERYAAAKKNGENFIIASIDMDNLKPINDTYGHTTGDAALKIIAKSISNVLLENEIAARVGGDEFAVILDPTVPNRGEKFKFELNAAVLRLGKEFKDIKIGASVGYFELKEKPSATLPECIQAADMRMYENKKIRKFRGQL